MYHYKCIVDRVVDGDTVDLHIQLGFNITIKERFRLANINAPEVRGPEKPEGIEATLWLEARLRRAGNNLYIQSYKNKKGKYGRWIGTLYDGAVNINMQMVQAGYAVEKEY